MLCRNIRLRLRSTSRHGTKNAAKARSFAAGGQRSIAAKTGTSFFLLQADEDIVPQIVVQTHVERGSVIQIRFENAFEKAELVFGHL